MYAINLKYKTPMYGAMIGSAIGGCVAGLLKTAIYAFAGASSVIALPLFVSADKPNNLLYMIISVLVGVVATSWPPGSSTSPRRLRNKEGKGFGMAFCKNFLWGAQQLPISRRRLARRRQRGQRSGHAFVRVAYDTASDHGGDRPRSVLPEPYSQRFYHHNAEDIA